MAGCGAVVNLAYNLTPMVGRISLSNCKSESIHLIGPFGTETWIQRIEPAIVVSITFTVTVVFYNGMPLMSRPINQSIFLADFVRIHPSEVGLSILDVRRKHTRGVFNFVGRR